MNKPSEEVENARLELQALLKFANDLARPDWCLSVPSTAKVAIAKLVAALEDQQIRLAAVGDLAERIDALASSAGSHEDEDAMDLWLSTATHIRTALNARDNA